MERQNVTLSLPKSLLKKAKTLAIKQDRSLSELLRETLEEKVMQKSGNQRARERAFIRGRFAAHQKEAIVGLDPGFPPGQMAGEQLPPFCSNGAPGIVFLHPAPGPDGVLSVAPVII